MAVTAVCILLYLFAVVIVAVFAVRFMDRRVELALLLAARGQNRVCPDICHQHRVGGCELWGADSAVFPV